MVHTQNASTVLRVGGERTDNRANLLPLSDEKTTDENSAQAVTTESISTVLLQPELTNENKNPGNKADQSISEKHMPICLPTLCAEAIVEVAALALFGAPALIIIFLRVVCCFLRAWAEQHSLMAHPRTIKASKIFIVALMVAFTTGAVRVYEEHVVGPQQRASHATTLNREDAVQGKGKPISLAPGSIHNQIGSKVKPPAKMVMPKTRKTQQRRINAGHNN
jgi:hypothetical protein